MGKLGRWIDGRSDVQKDRIIRAQNWLAGALFGTAKYGPGDGTGACLVGHAYGVTSKDDYAFKPNDLIKEAEEEADEAGVIFDTLVDRFGLKRVVRACKIRAGADLEDLEKIRAPEHTFCV